MEDGTKSAGSTSNEDCFGCRIISGFGVILIGSYIYIQAKKRRPIESVIMKLISTGAVSLGFARLFNIYPFDRRK